MPRLPGGLLGIGQGVQPVCGCADGLAGIAHRER